MLPFKYCPLLLPQFVLWGQFSSFLPQSPQTSRLFFHPSLLSPTALSVCLHFTFKIATISLTLLCAFETPVPSLSLAGRAICLEFSQTSHCLLPHLAEFRYLSCDTVCSGSVFFSACLFVVLPYRCLFQHFLVYSSTAEPSPLLKFRTSWVWKRMKAVPFCEPVKTDGY